MRTRLVIAAVALALAAAACGDSAATTTTAPPATAAPTTTLAPTTTEPAPTTTEAATTTTTTTAPTTTTQPASEPVRFTGADGVESEITDTSRVVSLAGDITEIVFELGLGSQVAAIDVTTTYPPAATELPVVGFAQQLAPEGVLAFGPTLVIGDEFTSPPETIEQLRSAGVPVVILPTQTTLDGVLVKIRQIAEILGAVEEGEALAARVGAEIDAARALAATAATSPRVAYVYARGPQTLLLFGAGMPTSAMIEGAGAVDAAVASGVRGPVPLTPEALVAAGPDVIVLPSAGLGALGGIEAFLQIPGVAETPAGQNGAFLDYDEAYFFNLGPRAGQALMDFVLELHPELADGS